MTTNGGTNAIDVSYAPNVRRRWAHRDGTASTGEPIGIGDSEALRATAYSWELPLGEVAITRSTPATPEGGCSWAVEMEQGTARHRLIAADAMITRRFIDIGDLVSGGVSGHLLSRILG